jgi:hypothetical protein
MKIEVEGGELAIRNSHGNVAIIPKNKVKELKALLDEGCDSCIDDFVSKLPKGEDYAQDGTLVSELYTQKTGKSWSTAKQEGLTDGSLSQNLKLREQLLANKANLSTEPKDFKEAFKNARSTLGANKIFEFQGRKYGTNIAGEEFKPDEAELRKFNLSTPGVKKRLNEQNKSVVSPYTDKNTTKLEPEYKDWEEVKKGQADLNKASQAERIINYKSRDKSGKNYAVVDKKKGLVHIYQPGKKEPTYTHAIDLGGKPGDAQTTTKYKDLNEDGKITSADRVNGKFEVDWKAGNMSTGAGKFYISFIDKTGYGGEPLLNMMNERQYEQYKKTGKREDVSTSFHKGYIRDNQSRVSNGCIRCNKPTLDKLSSYLGKDSEVYILPEDDKNEFLIENDKLNFKVRSDKNYDSYTDLQGKTQKGQGINRGENTLNYKPIKAELDEKKFKENVFQENDYNDEKELNNTTKPFIKALESRKRDVMKAAKINGDVYNDIVKVAFGIYGTETNFGDTHSAVGNFARAINKAIDPKSNSSPDYKSKATTYLANRPSNSVGLTQIRMAQLNDREKDALKEVGITKPKELLDPEKSAMATMIILGIRYHEQLTPSQKKDVLTNLPKTWNHRENYSDRVKTNSQYLTLKQLQ